MNKKPTDHAAGLSSPVETTVHSGADTSAHAGLGVEKHGSHEKNDPAIETPTGHMRWWVNSTHRPDGSVVLVVTVAQPSDATNVVQLVRMRFDIDTSGRLVAWEGVEGGQAPIHRIGASTQPTQRKGPAHENRHADQPSRALGSAPSRPEPYRIHRRDAARQITRREFSHHSPVFGSSNDSATSASAGDGDTNSLGRATSYPRACSDARPIASSCKGCSSLDRKTISLVGLLRFISGLLGSLEKVGMPAAANQLATCFEVYPLLAGARARHAIGLRGSMAHLLNLGGRLVAWGGCELRPVHAPVIRPQRLASHCRVVRMLDDGLAILGRDTIEPPLLDGGVTFEPMESRECRDAAGGLYGTGEGNFCVICHERDCR